jgi:hypothetical protein
VCRGLMRSVEAPSTESPTPPHRRVVGRMLREAPRGTKNHLLRAGVVLPCLQEGKDSLNLPHRLNGVFSLHFIENQGADMGVCLTKVPTRPAPTLRPPRTQQPFPCHPASRRGSWHSERAVV